MSRCRSDGNVAAKSGDGSIRIEHVSGRLDLRTGDGSIRGTDVSGQLTLNTGDGSVTLDGADGDLDVETGDGGVNIPGKLGVVQAAHRRRIGDVPRGAGQRDEGRLGRSRRATAASRSTCRRISARELDAHTGDGTIRNELGSECRAAIGQVSRRTVRGRVGAGGKLLKIRTGDGDIRLKAS